MKGDSRTRNRLFRLLAPALILGGCAGSLFKTQVAPPTLYLLSAARAAPAAAATGDPATVTGVAATSGTELMANLAVLRPLVRAGLDTDRIAALYPDRRLDYFADARWSAPLDEVIQGLAVSFFQSRAGLRNVSADATAFASAYWLEIDVTDFQAEYSVARPGGNPGGSPGGSPPTVHVHLLARIGSSGERRVIARFEADVRQPATENRMGAIVAAYEGAADKALLQLAAGCAAALASETSSPP